MKKFQQNMNRELKRPYPDRRKLETQCVSILAFGGGSEDVLDCPIWILCVNIVAIEMLRRSKLPPSKGEFSSQRPLLQRFNSSHPPQPPPPLYGAPQPHGHDLDLFQTLRFRLQRRGSLQRGRKRRKQRRQQRIVLVLREQQQQQQQRGQQVFSLTSRSCISLMTSNLFQGSLKGPEASKASSEVQRQRDLLRRPFQHLVQARRDDGHNREEAARWILVKEQQGGRR